MESRFFNGLIQDDQIFERCYDRTHRRIGVVLEVYERLEKEHNELVDSYNEYQKLLIDLGREHGKTYINVPLTPEEQIQRLLKINEDQARQIDSLVACLKEQVNEHTKSSEDGRVVKSRRKRGGQGDGSDNQQL